MQVWKISMEEKLKNINSSVRRGLSLLWVDSQCLLKPTLPISQTVVQVLVIPCAMCELIHSACWNRHYLLVKQ